MLTILRRFFSDGGTTFAAGSSAKLRGARGVAMLPVGPSNRLPRYQRRRLVLFDKDSNLSSIQERHPLVGCCEKGQEGAR